MTDEQTRKWIEGLRAIHDREAPDGGDEWTELLAGVADRLERAIQDAKYRETAEPIVEAAQTLSAWWYTLPSAEGPLHPREKILREAVRAHNEAQKPAPTPREALSRLASTQSILNIAVDIDHAPREALAAELRARGEYAQRALEQGAEMNSNQALEHVKALTQRGRDEGYDCHFCTMIAEFLSDVPAVWHGGFSPTVTLRPNEATKPDTRTRYPGDRRGIPTDAQIEAIDEHTEAQKPEPDDVIYRCRRCHEPQSHNVTSPLCTHGDGIEERCNWQRGTFTPEENTDE